MLHFKTSSEFKQMADSLFNQEKRRLQLFVYDADIQHIGGTAVPELLTKGDLDINVRVKQEDFILTIENLKKIYAVNQPENWTNTFASFKDDNSFELPLGVQVTVINSPQDFFVKHRDTLLNNPKLVKDFNELKNDYEGKDMDSYRTAKMEFLVKNFPR